MYTFDCKFRVQRVSKAPRGAPALLTVLRLGEVTELLPALLRIRERVAPGLEGAPELVEPPHLPAYRPVVDPKKPL